MSPVLVLQLTFLFAFVFAVVLLIRSPQRFGINRDDPFYPWKRWTWNAVPPNWKSKLLQSFFWSAAFALTTLFEQGLVLVCIPWLLSLNFAVHSVRIVANVLSLKSLGGRPGRT